MYGSHHPLYSRYQGYDPAAAQEDLLRMFRPTDRDTIDPGAPGATILRWVVLATALVGLVTIAVVLVVGFGLR
jgi:hypothetical protein